MPDNNSFLEASWNKLTGELVGPKAQLYDQLIKRYKEDKRHYHNLSHIESLLRLVDRYGKNLKSSIVVGLSIWYHDAVYDPASTTNEEDSAKLAKLQLPLLGLSLQQVDNISKLILATKNHLAPSHDYDAKFFLDIDLSILASCPKNYETYVAQIRREYVSIPNDTYTEGRKKVLESFLRKESIYKTELFQNLWENSARQNLLNELTQLS